MKFDFGRIKDFFAELPANFLALSWGEQVAWGAIVLGAIFVLTGLVMLI